MTPLAHLDTLHDWAALLAIAALTALTIWAAHKHVASPDRMQLTVDTAPDSPLLEQ